MDSEIDSSHVENWEGAAMNTVVAGIAQDHVRRGAGWQGYDGNLG
jgi:hypothetical protein